MSTPTSSAPSTAADLATLATQASPPAAMGGNRPILLTDPNQLMVVVAGSVNLFSVPVNGNTVDSAREYIGQVGPVVCSWASSQVDANGSLPFAVLAVGATNTLISKLIAHGWRRCWGNRSCSLRWPWASST